jgi:hypothetical protein
VLWTRGDASELLLLTSPAAGSSPNLPKLSSPDANNSGGGWLVTSAVLLPVVVVLLAPSPAAATHGIKVQLADQKV